MCKRFFWHTRRYEKINQIATNYFAVKILRLLFKTSLNCLRATMNLENNCNGFQSDHQNEKLVCRKSLIVWGKGHWRTRTASDSPGAWKHFLIRARRGERRGGDNTSNSIQNKNDTNFKFNGFVNLFFFFLTKFSHVFQPVSTTLQNFATAANREKCFVLRLHD